MVYCIRHALYVAPIFLLAGCWQKIEYKGSPTSATKPPAASSVANDKTTDATPPTAAEPVVAPVSNVSVDHRDGPPASDVQPVAATPIPTPSAPASTNKKADVDRYATPPKDVAATPSRYEATEPAPLPQQPAVEPQPLKRHTDASPVSATVDVAPPKSLSNSSSKIRPAVWTLGSRLSLAALAHDRRMAANSVPTWLDEAQSACKVLETTVPELPQPAAANDPSPASRQVIDYLLNEGQRLGRDFSKRFGPEQAALFEVALKSNFLLLLYSPGSGTTNSLSDAISRAAPKAKLPSELWKPVIDRINAKASAEDVQTAVRQMHADVARYLANAAEPTGR